MITVDERELFAAQLQQARGKVQGFQERKQELLREVSRLDAEIAQAEKELGVWVTKIKPLVDEYDAAQKGTGQ